VKRLFFYTYGFEFSRVWIHTTIISFSFSRYFSYVRLLCLTNAIRRFQVKSLSTGSPTLYSPLWPKGLIGHTSAETFPGFPREKCSKKIVFPGRHYFHLREHKKDKYYVYNNDQQHWLMNASHYGRRPSYFFFLMT